MEVLKPIIEQPEQKAELKELEPTIEKTPNLKHLEFLSHLGMKDKIFDDEVMEKIAYIAERVDFSEFEDIALRVGNDGFTPKLDKIYTYIQLRDKYEDLERKQELIKEALNQYGK